MFMRKELEWWLRAADRDALMAQKLDREGIFEGAAFHSQQSAEKYLKALLIAIGAEWRKTHSCVAILMGLRERGIDVPEPVLTLARKLDVHYIDARYPNGVGGAPEQFYDAAISAELIQAAQSVKSFVLEKLQHTTRQA